MRVKKFPKFTMVLVLWEDTTSDAQWHNKQELEKAKTTLVRSLGYFLDNKKRMLKIAHSITDDIDSDYTVIPWGCIKEIKEVILKNGG